LKTSNFGKNATKILASVLLVLCLTVQLVSCGGTTYTFGYTLEELKKDLISVEIIVYLDLKNEDSPNLHETLYSIENSGEKEEILCTLSEIEFLGINVPQRGYSKYGIKLTYPDRCTIFTITHIVTLDENLCVINIREGGYRELYRIEEKLFSLLGKYVSSEEIVYDLEHYYDAT